MRIKHILYVSIFTLLSIIVPLTSVSVHANDTVFDFSKKDSQTTSTLDAINLIKVITNGDVTNAEQEFLQDPNVILNAMANFLYLQLQCLVL